MYTNQRQSQDTKELRRLGGRWLKEKRESAGLSQRQLAEILGVEYYTFISQIETGHGRIPPDRYQAWADAIGLDLPDFVREILRYYDPVTFSILFGDRQAAAAAAGSSGATLTSENRQLREQVRELQRLLGKKTMELEQARERQGRGKTAGSASVHGRAERLAPAIDLAPQAAGRRKTAGVAAMDGAAPYGDTGD